MICGVDEAGKGPVLGNLFLCGAAMKEEDLPKLEALGVADSKVLTRAKREALYENILALVKHKVISIPPQEIDEAIAHPSCNLNILEAAHTATILEALHPEKAIVDCPDPTPEKYKQRIMKSLSYEPELSCEHKAERHAIVAAASIIAKVLRDRHMDEVKEKHGMCGSGYASDPTTQQFLREHWQEKKHHVIIRRSWASYKNLQNTHSQRTLGGF